MTCVLQCVWEAGGLSYIILRYSFLFYVSLLLSFFLLSPNSFVYMILVFFGFVCQLVLSFIFSLYFCVFYFFLFLLYSFLRQLVLSSIISLFIHVFFFLLFLILFPLPSRTLQGNTWRKGNLTVIFTNCFHLPDRFSRPSHHRFRLFTGKLRHRKLPIQDFISTRYLYPTVFFYGAYMDILFFIVLFTIDSRVSFCFYSGKDIVFQG